MFRPVGSQPPGVYWRRRLALIASLIVVLVLIVLTVKVVFGGGSAPPGGQASTPVTTSPQVSTSSQPASTTSKPNASSSSTTPTTSTSSTSRTGTAATCVRSQLAIQAVSDKTSYQVGATPHLMLQVTNTGPKPCVQDLADPQIELLVYNGESRVWGSHDCLIAPGVNKMTLNRDAPVRVTVIWSGQSSNANNKHTPAACGPRQTVGAGTYTLYAKLAGKTGKAAQFSIG